MRMRDLSALKGVDRELELLEKKKCKNVVGSFSSPRKKNKLKKKKKKKKWCFFFFWLAVHWSPESAAVSRYGDVDIDRWLRLQAPFSQRI